MEEDIFTSARDLRKIDPDKERLLSIETTVETADLPVELFKQIDTSEIMQNLEIFGSKLGEKERITKDVKFTDHPILKEKMIEPVFHVKMEEKILK